VSEFTIRPTIKFIRAGYVAVTVITLAALAASLHYSLEPAWLPALALLLYLWPVARHIKRQTTVVTVSGDRLRYESGLISKSTRTIQLSKVQDVRVDQGLPQRLAGVGNLSIETAGESSRLTVENIDAPQQVADRIMDASQQKGAQA
jgi:uncharacterized membrane protein YdbT with pleckstrin-like domain